MHGQKNIKGALDRTVGRSRFGRVYGPVERRTAEWLSVAYSH